MTSEEWEDLCDGCGQCCMIDKQNCVACPLFNTVTRRCGNYRKRHDREICVKVTPDNVERLHEAGILPASCAYVRHARGLEPAPEPVEATPFHEASDELKAKYEAAREVWFKREMWRMFE